MAALTKELRDGPDGLKDNTAWALAELAQHDDGVDTVVAGGGEAALAWPKVLHGGLHSANRNATFALGQVTTHSAHVDG